MAGNHPDDERQEGRPAPEGTLGEALGGVPGSGPGSAPGSSGPDDEDPPPIREPDTPARDPKGPAPIREPDEPGPKPIIEEPDEQPPIEEPDEQPPIEEPDEEPPVREPDQEPPVEEPDDGPPEEPPIEEPDDEPPAKVGGSGPASSDLPPPTEAELPPPSSVPRPAPYRAPTVVPAAVVHDITPEDGSVLGDTRITITGEHLYRESIVRIDGAIARTIGADEPRELRVITPPRKQAGAVAISIQNPNSEVVEIEKAFRYDPLPAPKIVSVAPAHVGTEGGDEIQIVGEGFVDTSAVRLDGEPASAVSFVDATTLDVKVPAGKTGKAVTVTVVNPDGKTHEAKRAFTYDERYD